MTAVPTGTLVRPLAESRPPGRTWPAGPPALVPADQPTLDLGPGGGDSVGSRPWSTAVEATLVRSRWCARPSPRLPDARAWSISLALAVVESMSGSRPIGQLNRWVADEVLTAVFLHQRRRRSAPRRVATPPVLHSVRVQHPEPDVAEVSAHVRIQERSMALAFRLEAVGERWLCTALELGPRA